MVLANVNFAFRFLDEYDFVTSHSNLPEIMHWVWNRSIFSTGRLSHEQIALRLTPVSWLQREAHLH